MISYCLNCLKYSYLDKTNGKCTAIGDCSCDSLSFNSRIKKNKIALLKKENNDILTILHAYRHICGGISPNKVQTLIKERKKALYGEI